MNKKKWNKQAILRILGNILTVLGLVFIVRQVMKFDVDFWFLLNPQVILIIFLLALLLATSVFTNSIAWKKLVEMLSLKKLKYPEIIHVYAKSNIAKYLPGNVMHYASRNLLGCKYDISHKDMIFSSALEVILKIISSFLLVILLIRGQIFIVAEQLNEKTSINTTTILIIVGAMMVCTIAFLVYKNRKSLKGKLQIFPLVYAFISYVFVFVVNAVAFLAIAATLYPKTDFALIYTAGIYIIAWLIGYLTPGSPGGIGIRETIMILMLGAVFTPAGITQISVCLRLVTIIADLLAFAVDAIVTKKLGTKIDDTESCELR